MELFFVFAVVSLVLLIISILIPHVVSDLPEMYDYCDGDDEVNYYYTRDGQIPSDKRIILFGVTVLFLTSAAGRFFGVSYLESLLMGVLYGAIAWSAICIVRMHRWRQIF